MGSLGALASGNEELAHSLRNTLISLAQHQSHLGAMPRVCDEPGDLTSSDATPLFLVGLAVYRQIARAPGFLDETAQKALDWCDSQDSEYGGNADGGPTSDLCDDHQVFGRGLFVHTLLHTALVLFGRGARAELIRKEINSPGRSENSQRASQEGLGLPWGPYYALCNRGREQNETFDLLGNSIAVLSGVASRERAIDIIQWLELRCDEMRAMGQLQTRCPPIIIPPFLGEGEAMDGGIWPFACGFYVAALVAAGQRALAEQQLIALTALCSRKKDEHLEFGFNGWIRASDGQAMGEDWQYLSASVYLYAARCVELGRTPVFEAVRSQTQGWFSQGKHTT
jgi:hypothetical protein